MKIKNQIPLGVMMDFTRPKLVGEQNSIEKGVQDDMSDGGRKLEVGDVVTLQSGSCELTVSSIIGTQVECVWMTDDGELKTGRFPMKVLDYLT